MTGMDLAAPHAGFVIAAYVLSAIVLAGLVIAGLASLRREERELSGLEERNVPRRRRAR